MKTITDKAKMLRKELKGLGYNNKQISVTSKNSSIRVKIKDMSINNKEIEKIANVYKDVSYCEVSYDYDSLKNESDKFIDKATQIYENYDFKFNISNDKYRIDYKRNDLSGIPCIYLNTVNVNGFIDTVMSYSAYCIRNISEFLTFCKYQYNTELI